MQRGIIKLKKTPYIISSYCVAGKKEYEGPLGKQFDDTYQISRILSYFLIY